MEHFSDRFEIIDYVSGDSFVFRFLGPAISPKEIEAFCQLSGDDILALRLGAQARVERSLEVMGSGKIAVPLRHAILQMMYLSYIEMVRIEKGAEQAARLFSGKVFENLGLAYMPSKINAMRARVGARPDAQS
jgi:hypothetical protein